LENAADALILLPSVALFFLYGPGTGILQGGDIPSDGRAKVRVAISKVMTAKLLLQRVPHILVKGPIHLGVPHAPFEPHSGRSRGLFARGCVPEVLEIELTLA